MKRISQHGNGVALIPPRMGSKWFHKHVLHTCDAILFLEGRVSFLDKTERPVKGNNSDSILVAFGEANVDALRKCGLAGKLWEDVNRRFRA